VDGGGRPGVLRLLDHYLVDVEAGIIVDVRQHLPCGQPKSSRPTMIERVEKRFDLKPERLIGDMAHGAAPMLGWLVEEKQIAPHIPVWDRTQRDDATLSSGDFDGMTVTMAASHRQSPLDSVASSRWVRSTPECAARSASLRPTNRASGPRRVPYRRSTAPAQVEPFSTRSIIVRST